MSRKRNWSALRDFARASTRSAQRGFGLIEVALALIVFTLAVLFAYKAYLQWEDGRRAENQAGVMTLIRDGAEALLLEHYADYQAGLPVVRNGVTLPFGNAEGEALSPTVAQLNAMDVGLKDAAENPFYKSLSTGGYKIQIERVPAGCETSPMGVTCNVTGLICFDTALRDPKKPEEITDGFAIGRMLTRLGENGGASVDDTDGSRIYGFGGGWETPNPITGTPSGIVCSRFGFGSAGFGQFLRVRDTRDPEFQNNLTVAGGVNIQSSAALNAACTVAESGRIVTSQLPNGKTVLLRCDGTSYQPVSGIEYTTAGSTCTTTGDFALDPSSGISLVCSNGVWVNQEGRGVRQLGYYSNGSVVPAPTCPAGHTPSAAIATVAAANIIGTNNPGNNTGSFQASINGSWVVSITGSDGTPAGSNAMALVITSCVQ